MFSFILLFHPPVLFTGTDLLGEVLRLCVPAVGQECTRWPPEASPCPGILLVSVDVLKATRSENRKSLSS